MCGSPRPSGGSSASASTAAAPPASSTVAAAVASSAAAALSSAASPLPAPLPAPLPVPAGLPSPLTYAFNRLRLPGQHDTTSYSVAWRQLFDAAGRDVPISNAGKAEQVAQVLVSSYACDYNHFLAPVFNLGVSTVVVDTYNAEESPSYGGTQRELDGRANVTIVYPKLRAAYSCMHAKIVILRFVQAAAAAEASAGASGSSSNSSSAALAGLPTSRLRVAITSGNLFVEDWSLLSQTLHVTDYFPAGSAQAAAAVADRAVPVAGSSDAGTEPGPLYLCPSLSDFGPQLRNFLTRLAVPEDFIVKLVTGIDFSCAPVDLVLSVPGYHMRQPTPYTARVSSGSSGSKASKAGAGASSAGVKRPRDAADDSDEEGDDDAGAKRHKSGGSHGGAGGSGSATSVPELPSYDRTAPVYQYGQMRVRLLRAHHNQLMRKLEVAVTELHAALHDDGSGAAAAAAAAASSTRKQQAQAPSSLGTDAFLPLCYQVSSCGTLHKSFLLDLFASCHGRDAAQCGEADELLSSLQRKGGPSVTQMFQQQQSSSAGGARDATSGLAAAMAQLGLRSPISIIFPARATVMASAMGAHTAGWLCLKRETFMKPAFPRYAFARYEDQLPPASGKKGALAHAKLLIPLPLTPTQTAAPGAPLPAEEARVSHVSCQLIRQWAYTGSANTSQPAWGTVSEIHKPTGPCLKVDHYEAGVLFPPVVKLSLPPPQALVTERQRQAYATVAEAASRFAVRVATPPPSFPCHFRLPPVPYTDTTEPWSFEALADVRAQYEAAALLLH